MREYSTPPAGPLPQQGNLADDVVRNAALAPDAPAFRRRTPSGWTDVTAGEFADQVRALARGLVAAGLEPGDRVALLSETRFEWTLVDYACWYVGCVPVPVYETSAPEQVEHVLSDSGARAAVTGSAALRDLVSGLTSAAALDHVWCLDDGAVDALVAAGTDVRDETIEARRAAVGPGSTATLIYTSGTTGPPKGCTLTHGNFLAELVPTLDLLSELFDDEEACTLLFLPLAHVFARVVQVGCVRAQVPLGHSSDVRRLREQLAEFRPTFVLAIPRVFERIFTVASQQAVADGRGRAFDRAVEVAIEYSRAGEHGRPGPVLRARHAVSDRLVYGRLRDELGGRCRYAVSGGAPLGDRLSHFFRGAGIPVLEGYGLTETTAAVTVNTPDEHKVGTVGRPLPGTSVRVGLDGELEVRGPQVFTGYWGDEAATAAVMDDGWLRTGDLGEIDDEGFVRVTGRRTEILVTSGGKNVSPSTLENRVRAHPLVDQCLVVGDSRPFVAALVTLDRDAVREWAGHEGLPGADQMDWKTLAARPEVREQVSGAVEQANAAVSKAEAIRRFEVLAEEWTEENGLVTPSLKLRRPALLRERHHLVERLYED